MTAEILLTIAVVLLFLNILVLSIRLNNHANRLDYLESKDDDKLPDYEPVTIVYNPDATYTNVPTILHDAEKESR